MLDINQILTKINAKKIAGTKSSLDWGRSLMPYTADELNSLCYNRSELDSRALRNDHANFVASCASLSDGEREAVRTWLVKNYVEAAWYARGNPKTNPESAFGIRPRWTWDNFMSRLSGKNLSYLDVGPCHGLHSNLIYWYNYDGEFTYHAADILPAYLQLQVLSGVDARYFDATYMDLLDVYDEASMDVILCTEVIEHLKTDEATKVLTGCLKVLRPGGKMMISFPVDAKPFDYFQGIAFGHQQQPDLTQTQTLLKELGLNDQTYTKLFSGKTYQHVISGTKS